MLFEACDVYVGKYAALNEIHKLRSVRSGAPLKFWNIDAHPSEVEWQLNLLKNHIREQPDVKWIATTNNPCVVNYIDSAHIIVCALDARGVLRTKRLCKHPDSFTNLPNGHFWVNVGEDWVLQ